MKKIKVSRFGTIHYTATCTVCSFNAGIQTTETPEAKDVRTSVYKHVRKTGHLVRIESGKISEYKLKET